MKTHKLIIIAVAALVCVSTANAGSELRIGSAGAQELLLPVGARGYALGGALVSNVSGVEATFWNPAGVSREYGTEVMFTHIPYFAGIDINFFGATTQIGDLGSFGFAAKIVDIGEIEETTEFDVDGTGSVYSPTLSVIGLTFSRQMTHQVNFGVTANFISERIFEVSANGLAFDFGFMFDPRWNGVQIGLVVKNIGGDMRFDGPGFNRSSSSLGNRNLRPENALAELPTHVVIGASYTRPTEGLSSVTLSGNFQSNNFSEDAWIGGLEYSYDDKYFLRGGYNYSVQQDYVYGISVGGGIAIDLDETRLTVEASWRETEFFDNEVVFTGKLNF